MVLVDGILWGFTLWSFVTLLLNMGIVISEFSQQMVDLSHHVNIYQRISQVYAKPSALL